MALGGWVAGSGVVQAFSSAARGFARPTPLTVVPASIHQHLAPLDDLFGYGPGRNAFDCCVHCGICEEDFAQVMQRAHWACPSVCARSGMGGLALAVDGIRCTVDCVCIPETGPVT